MTILIAEPDPEEQQYLRSTLSPLECEVEIVSSGKEAYKRCRDDHPILLIVNMMMPDVSGIELLRRVRSDSQSRRTPVIILSERAQEFDRIIGLEMGADDYIGTPFSPNEFILRVKALLRRAFPKPSVSSAAFDFEPLSYDPAPRTACINKEPISVTDEHSDLLQPLKSAVHLKLMTEIEHEAPGVLGSSELQVGDRADLEVKFESALEHIYVVYQPIVRWSTRSIIGYEALVRSLEPTIPHPGALFDAAERLDRLYDLTRRIRAMAPVPFANNEVTHEVQLFFNLHVRELNDQTLYDHESGLAKMADRVVLEITEHASLNEVHDPHGRIAQLRDIGYKIAVDDLGAGYAGLTSFATLEPEVVKLDMALVRDLHLSSTKRKLVKSMTQLCADMGMSVVAEGVESAEECAALVEAGCDIFQGYLFGKPSMPFADVEYTLLPTV